MKNIILIIILSLLVSCSTTEKKDVKIIRGSAIVEGKVHNFENGSKVVSFSGETIVGEISQTAIIDSLGNFRTEIELLNPQDIYLSYENGGAYLYLKPFDSLFIEFDSKSLEQDMYEISGSNPATSKYIRDFYKFQGPYSYEPKYGDSVTEQEFLNDLEQQMNVEDSVLNEFSKLYNPTDEFMHWAKKNMIYSIAGNLLVYIWYFDVNHKQYKSEIYNTDLFPVDDDFAIISGNYLVHLNNYLIKYYRDTVLTKYSEKNEVFAASTYLFDKLIKTEKPGISRDIMIYKFFLGLLENPFSGRDALWKKYEDYIGNQELVNILREKKSRIENQDNGEETALKLKFNTKSESIENYWKTITSKHKDKIIYVDIWATWCGPCRDEIPHAIDLHDYFEGKPVAFVNLCLASKKDDWKKFLTQNHIGGDNYFFNEDETKLLRDDLKFHGYPTYMIIDKNGALIEKNAPRPSSDEEIKNVLMKLLNK